MSLFFRKLCFLSDDSFVLLFPKRSIFSLLRLTLYSISKNAFPRKSSRAKPPQQTFEHLYAPDYQTFLWVWGAYVKWVKSSKILVFPLPLSSPASSTAKPPPVDYQPSKENKTLCSSLFWRSPRSALLSNSSRCQNAPNKKKRKRSLPLTVSIFASRRHCIFSLLSASFHFLSPRMVSWGALRRERRTGETTTALCVWISRATVWVMVK